MPKRSRHLVDLDSWDANTAFREGDAVALASYCLEASGSLRAIADLVRSVRPGAPLPGSTASQDLSHGVKLGRASPEQEVQEGVHSQGRSAGNQATQRWLPDAAGSTEDWTGTTSQLREAIERRAPRLVGEYLCDLADVLEQFHAVLAADPVGSEPWQLVFRRRRSGKPANPRRLLLEEDAIAMAVRLRLPRVKKLEAAVSDVALQFGVSRVTVMRALKAHKSRQLGRPGSC